MKAFQMRCRWRRLPSFILLGIALFASCSRGDQNGQKPPVPVMVGEVKRENTPVYAQTIGKLTPELTVEIKAKVSGTLKEIYASEGSAVSKDDPLFRFGKSSYEAKLEKTEANLLKDEANLIFAKKKLERYMTLAEKEYVTQLSLDEMQKEVAAYEAQVKADHAEVQLAKMDLEDTLLFSPIDGIMGEEKVEVYNSVDKGAILAQILRIDMLYVDFYLPEKFLPQVLPAVRGDKELEIEVETQDGQKALGKFTFMDPGVDPITGTIFLRGLIKNDKRELQPGQYVNVRLKLKEIPEAAILPLAAVQIGQQGHYIYILKPDQTVELKVVKPIYTTGQGIVIAEDLPAGTKVITDGHINLVPGAKVMVQEEK